MYLIIMFVLLFIVGIIVLIAVVDKGWYLLTFVVAIFSALMLIGIAISTMYVVDAHADSVIREYDRTEATVERMSESDVYKSPAISKQVDEVNKSVQTAKWASQYWILSGTYNEELSKRDYIFINKEDANKSFKKD